MQTDHVNANATDALRRAYQTLRPLLLAERRFRACVGPITKRTVRFERVRYVIERRAIERRIAPAPGTRRSEVEPLISPDYDPWAVVMDELPTATRQVCVCPACEGDERRACDRCTPYERRVHTWLEVARVERREVYANPAEVAIAWLPEALDEADFLRADWAHRLEHDELLSAEAVAALPAALRPALHPRDRILEARLQRFAVDVQELRYQTALGTGLVELAGSPLHVYTAARAPLWRRGLVASAAGLVAAGVCSAAALSYRAQHPWFAQHGRAGAILVLGCAASALLFVALLGWSRARGARSVRSTWCPTGAALGLAAASAALLGSAQPTLQAAHEALRRNELERAALTADALRAGGLSRAAHEALLEDIRLARIGTADTLEAKIGLASAGPWSPARQPAMRRALLHAMQPHAGQARAAQDDATLAHLSELLAQVLPGDSHGLAVEAAKLATRACLAQGDVECTERALLKLQALGAMTLRERGRQALAALLRDRFDRSLLAVSRSRTAQVELAHLDTAAALAAKLDALGAPVARSLRVVLERAQARAARQVKAFELAIARTQRARERSPQVPDKQVADKQERRTIAEERRTTLVASTRARRW